jgi:L-ribulokinase
MQIYADATGRPISVAGAAQASALGAAMLGAVGAGTARGGYATLREAAASMAPAPSTVYEPDSDRRRQYDTLYREYKRLYDYFGRGGSDVMRLLREARRRD